MKLRFLIVKLFTIIGIVNSHAEYHFNDILYGANYYHEYSPTERLDEDIRMMKDAGINFVRLGESTWSLFEPREGEYKLEWMGRILDKMYEANIKVMFGTPTYSVPAWLVHKHPEILLERKDGSKEAYGHRQNMDINNPTYRFYCEKIIRVLMSHYASHPAIIGFQVDNEVEPRGINNRDHFINFRNYVKKKFNGNLDSLNSTWGLSHWGMNINSWEEFYPADGAFHPAYKNEWERHNRIMCEEFLNWQCDIINEYKRKDQFITHDYMTAFYNVDQIAGSRQMQYPGINIYHQVQDNQDGQMIAYAGDFMRNVKANNYLVLETNAQGTGWGECLYQKPPYDGQLRQNAYSHLASGANLVSYWPWATLHYGHETYWKGVLGHDQQPNRIYNEVTKVGNELKTIGRKLVNLKKNNKAAILYSHDSFHALTFLPYSRNYWDNYQIDKIHRALYTQNIESDIICADNYKGDFLDYELLVIPSLYIATDELLEKINKFVKEGGHVVMLPKSGYCNENSMVRSELAPGPLRTSAGIHYQEYCNIDNLSLKDDPFNAGEDNIIKDWYEFIIVDTAEPLAYVDHPFFGKWPAITKNKYGKGTFIYIGTNPSQEILNSIVRKEAEEAGIIYSEFPKFPIIIRKGTNQYGKEITYILNYSPTENKICIDSLSGRDLITNKSYNKGSEINCEPWGVVIIEK